MLFSAAQLLGMIAGACIGTAGGFAVFDARRARLRAARAQCSRCGKPWSAAYPEAERFLVQGREVCSPCAVAMRRRLPRLLRRFGWTSAIGIGWVIYEVGTMRTLGGNFSVSGMVVALALPVSFGGITMLALSAAARRNRSVLSRGVRIPEPLLDQAGLCDDEELRAQAGRIVIAASHRPRADWAAAAARVHARGGDVVRETPAPAFDDTEWEW